MKKFIVKKSDLGIVANLIQACWGTYNSQSFAMSTRSDYHERLQQTATEMLNEILVAISEDDIAEIIAEACRWCAEPFAGEFEAGGGVIRAEEIAECIEIKCSDVSETTYNGEPAYRVETF